MYSLLHSRPFSNILAVDRNPIHPTQRTETPGGAHIRCSSVDLIALSCWSYRTFFLFSAPVPFRRSKARMVTIFSLASFPGASGAPRPTCPAFAQGYRNLSRGFWIPFCDRWVFRRKKKLKWWRMADNGWQRRACNGASRNKCSISKRKRLDFLCSPMYGQRTVLDYVNIPLNC